MTHPSLDGLAPGSPTTAGPAASARPWSGPRNGLLDQLSLYAIGDRRRLSGPPADPLPVHRDRYGPRPTSRGLAGERLIARLEAAELTGHGGAHFPAARKWRTVRESPAQQDGPVVVANAAEGEPLSAKDAALLQSRPHLVLDGLACAAEATGAGVAVLWLHEGAEASTAAVRAALEERRHDPGGADAVPVRLAFGPDRYLTGESSAVVRALGGGPALPAFTRVPAAVRGIHGRPTLVQNVETLARAALIARRGTGDGPVCDPLVTVLTGAGLAVCEVSPETTLRQAVQAADPRLRADPQAVLVGGFGGTWISFADAGHLRLGHPDELRVPTLTLRELGAGVLAPIPSGACGLRETAAVLDHLARSSARQCGPCTFGSRELADLMTALARGTAGRRGVARLERILGQLDGRGACALPDGAAAIARSALTVFADDVTRHTRRRPCPPGPAALPVPGGIRW